MIITSRFDVWSLCLFIFIGILGAFFLYKGNKVKDNAILVKKGKKYFALFWLLFTCFAAFRYVGDNVGGTDSMNYINYFKNCLNDNSNYLDLIREPLFLIYCQMIRIVTSHTWIFFFITYGIIAFSYLYFIKCFCPTDIEYSPFILVIFPYLRSLCTMRSGLAIAIYLLGLTQIEKRKWLCVILLVCSVFIHRMSIVYCVIFIFYYLYKNHIWKLKGYRLAIFFAFYIIISYLGALVVRQFVISNNLFSGTDSYYIQMSVGSSILDRWPMFIMQLLLLIFMVMTSKKINDNKMMFIVKTFCIFDICMLPASLVIGIWRGSEFLYIIRLIMWGSCIKAFLKYFEKNSKRFIQIVFFIAFLLWLIFRICSEYEDLGIMPYLFTIMI